MSLVVIETRGLSNWRDRLADPDRQWKRGFSAFETAVSWELAARSGHRLPQSIRDLFNNGPFGEVSLGLAVAEHKVALDGRGGDSQCDVWALLTTATGLLSLSVEAKAQEAFGTGHQSLAVWLQGGSSAASPTNRRSRWEFVARHLPEAVDRGYESVPFQLLHRCAASVVEARRLGLIQAAFVVQAFDAPATSYEQFAKLEQSMGLVLERNKLQMTKVGDVVLGVGWADSPLATDQGVAAVAS